VTWLAAPAFSRGQYIRVGLTSDSWAVVGIVQGDGGIVSPCRRVRFSTLEPGAASRCARRVAKA